VSAVVAEQGLDLRQEVGKFLQLQSRFAAVRKEIQTLLYYEAWLLDNNKYEQWLTLLGEDLRYMAPVRRKVEQEVLGIGSIDSGGARVCHFNDGKMDLGFRVARLRTGYDHYNKPSSFVRRMIGNVLLLNYDEARGEATVTSNFMVFRAREEKEEALLVGAREDLWRREAERGWLMARRMISLDHYMVPPLSVLF
jgi:3-phenylpropionate/cinnamic acid dioxygenase small subunit